MDIKELGLVAHFIETSLLALLWQQGQHIGEGGEMTLRFESNLNRTVNKCRLELRA